MDQNWMFTKVYKGDRKNGQKSEKKPKNHGFWPFLTKKPKTCKILGLRKKDKFFTAFSPKMTEKAINFIKKW